MNIDNLKNKQRHLPKALLCLSGLLALLIAAKVSAFVMNSDQIQNDIARTLNCPGRSEKNIKKFQSQYTDATDALKENNLFKSPVVTVHKKNPVTRVTAVLGNQARIANDWYEVGDKIGDAQITKISPNEVTIVWNEKESTLKPFDTVTFAPPPKQRSKDKGSQKVKSDKNDKNDKKQPQPERMEGRRPTGRPQFSDDERRNRMQEYMNRLSPEDRERMRERMRSRGGSRGGGSSSRGGGPRR